MIFATVGSQEPFDRLVQVVDAWAGAAGRSDVFAQIAGGEYQPEHIEYCRFLPPDEFERRCREARVIVSHAGMGTIITALRLEKPLLVMPRRGALHETRNDHQYATAQHFSRAQLLHVAMDEHELTAKLDQLDDIEALGKIGNSASDSLMLSIRAFIEE